MLKFTKNDKAGERLSVADDRDPEDLRLGVLNVVSGIGYFYPTINLDAAYDANELKTIVRKLKRMEKLAKQRVNPRNEVCANTDCRTPFWLTVVEIDSVLTFVEKNMARKRGPSQIGTK